MARDAFAELEAAREAVLAEAERFVHELEPLLAESLRAGVRRLKARQAAHAALLRERETAALEEAAERAIAAGVSSVVERLREPEVWLSPLTAPDLPPRRPFGWPGWVPEWLARWLDRAGPERIELADLDDPSNRIWVAIASAATRLDPVLEEFGFEPEGRRLGGGRFGVQARTLPQLDPGGTLARRWRRYRAAYERMADLAGRDG